MAFVPIRSLARPLIRAVGQLDDPVFAGVVLRSIVWSVACFAVLEAGTIWMVHGLLNWHGLTAWAVDVLGTAGATLLALWLFLPIAAAIGTLYFDRIANAVERRFFPWLPPPRGASSAEQLWDGVTVAGRVLGLNVAALVLAVLFPGIGLILGLTVSSYAIGRGLFVAVAMRRMSRSLAEALYRSRRGAILLIGAALATASYVPLLNLLIPVVGTAAMVHILDDAIAASLSNSETLTR